MQQKELFPLFRPQCVTDKGKEKKQYLLYLMVDHCLHLCSDQEGIDDRMAAEL